jgi:hypothetical protein
MTWLHLLHIRCKRAPGQQPTTTTGERQPDDEHLRLLHLSIQSIAQGKRVLAQLGIPLMHKCKATKTVQNFVLSCRVALVAHTRSLVLMAIRADAFLF